MNETIGQQLREAREAQKITFEQAVSATHMRERYLRALEEGNFDLMPSMAQARGFLRAYASFLKLDPELLLAQLDSEDGLTGRTTERATVPLDDNRPVRLELEGTPTSAGVDYEQADRIFLVIGKQLQYQRELLGLSLDDVVRYTHVRRHYLQALEDGRLDDLPSPVQGRGMLDNYATFLGMDPEPLLLQFAEGLQARLTLRQAAHSEPVTAPIARRRRPLSLPLPLRRLLSPDILIGVTFAVFLVVFVVWGAIRIFAMNSERQPEPTAPSIAEVLLATPSPSPSPSLQPESLTPIPPSQEAAGQPADQVVDVGTIATAADGSQATALPFSAEGGPGVQVYITVLQRAWLRAIVDGKIEFEDRVIPGSAYPFVGDNSVEILTSNGAGIQVFYNQQDLGVLGSFGQIVDRVFTPQGVLTPTPTITPTPSLTPRVTPTVTLPNIPGVGTAPALP